MKTILKNMLVWDAESQDAELCDVILNEGRVGALTAPGSAEGTVLYDGSGKSALIPGLVNAHTHAAMSLVRGLGEELPLMDWLRTKIWPAEEKLGAEQILWGTRMAMLEMLAGGITSFADMYFFMNEVAEAVLESGMRAALCRGIVGVVEDQFESKLKEGVAFAAQYRHFNDRLRVQLGPHAPYTVHLDQMERMVGEAKSLNVGIHLHWLETQDEVEFFKNELKMSPLEYLEKTGLLEVRELLLAHSVWQNETDFPKLSRENITIVHNPKSNLKLGSGFAPVRQILDSHVRMALGTDGAASNNRLDIWDEMRTCALMHKGFHLDPTLVSARQVLKAATLDGAQGMGFEDVGLIRPGYWADLTVIDLDQPQYVGCTGTNLPEYLVYSGSSRDVRMTLVAGKVLYNRGKFLSLDSDKIVSENRRMRTELVSVL